MEKKKKDYLLDDDFDDLEDKKVKKNKKVEINDELDDIDYISLDDEDVDYSEKSVESRIETIEQQSKITMIMVIIILLFSLINTVVSFSGNNRNNDVANPGNSYDDSTSYDISSFKEIKATDIESDSKSGTIIVWIGRQGCSYCADYAPKLASVAKDYNVEVRYINLANIVNFEVEDPYVTDSTAYDTLKSLSGSGEWKTFAADYINQIPLTLVINKNKVIGGMSGTGEITKIEEMVEDAGFSK